MDLLRSRVTMVVLAAAVTVGMVATGAVGLFNALSAPDPAAAPGRNAPPGSVSSPAPAPKMKALGDAPEGASYTDFGEQCPDVECVRIVGITTEDGESDGGQGRGSGDDASKKAVDKVFNHLLEQGWGRVLPDNSANPDEVPLGESYLTDGQVLITTTPVDSPDATAGLMMMHAQQPGS
ncbi:hypothetical protein [Streptomonospora litoralis]|nr:hypothetical protein [Streptomonospora litoralis]